MGVTGIVGLDEPGGRRGPLFLGAKPGPQVYPLEDVTGYDASGLPLDKRTVCDLTTLGRRLTDAELEQEVDRLTSSGIKVLLLYYTLAPDQVRLVARYARQRGLAIIGELGATTYPAAIDAGVMAFVHTSRYSLERAPPALRAEVAKAPFGPPRRRFYEHLASIRDDAMVGAGPAGMEAARVLALRGHKVILFEKEDHLGGQMSLAMATSHKRKRIEPLIYYFAAQLSRLHVETKLNTEANTDLITDYAPDAVIVATGANPIIPPLPGIEQGNVFTAIDILAGRVKAGQKVLIIGGGSIGCETAEFLVENGKEVTVAEILPELASHMGFRDRLRLLMRIKTLPIIFLTTAPGR